MAAERDRGFATPQAVVAVGLALAFFVLLANLIVVQYGRGVVRAALDEGVRDASVAGAGPAACESAIREVLDGLLGGSMGDGVVFACREAGGLVEAEATASFPGWLPAVPDFTFRLHAAAVRELEP
ncbi:MAG: hypothetical protein ACRDVM_02345 [Acidimicrobiia bacterium]